LVEDDAVGRVKDGAHPLIGERHLAVFGLVAREASKLVDGTGTVHGDDGREVLEAVGSQQPQRCPLATRVELEHALGLPAFEHRVGRRVVEGDRCEVRTPPGGRRHALQCFTRELERVEPQKVE